MISHNGFIGRILVGTRHEKQGKWEKSRVENQKGDKFKRVARTLIKLLVVRDLWNTVLIPLFSSLVWVDQNLGTPIQE